MHEILLWTPFPTDSWDWQIGECLCDGFLNKRVKSISFGCLHAEDIFNDVIGKMWTEKQCTFEWFVLYIQLYSELIEKLQR